MGLLDLPDDILLKTLAASGCTSICMAATTCRRLRDMKTTLGEYPVFSSAIAQSAALDEAVADLCHRALTGMLGAVDFALVFTSRASLRTQAHRIPQLLQSKLPQGAVILGSSSAGLMGIDSSGHPFDLDPGFKAPEGVSHVSLLLGRLPGSSIRTFVTERHPSQDRRMDGLLTLAQEGLQAQLVILLATQQDGLIGPRGLLAKLQPPDQTNGGMVVAGGITPVNHCLFFSSAQHAPATPRVVALAICTPCQRGAELAAPLPPASPPQLDISAAALTLRGLEPVEQTPWSNFTAEPADGRHVTLTGPDVRAMYYGAGNKHPSMALWRAPNGVAAGASCMEAAAGGQPLALLYDRQFTHPHSLLLEFEEFEAGSLAQVLVQQPGTSLLAQRVTYSSEGTERVMRSELPKMRDYIPTSIAAPRPVAGSLSRMGHLACETYEAVRRSAREAGARSGTSALVLFSCIGRGQVLHGAAGVELGLLDQLIGGELPMVGTYCNLELGPYLRRGYAGWSVASSRPLSHSDPSADGGTEWSAAAGDPATSTFSNLSIHGPTARAAAAAACAAGVGMQGVAADGGPGDHTRSWNSAAARVQDASEFKPSTSVFVALGAC